MLKEFPTRVAVFVVAVPLRLVLLLFVSFFYFEWMAQILVKKLQGNKNRAYIAIPEVCF